MRDLICICHLRWDFVWQRPQHLLSRLAQQREENYPSRSDRAWRILVVEEPVTDTNCRLPWLERFTLNSAVSMQGVRLHFPASEDYWLGFNDPRAQPIYERLLLDYLRSEGYHDPVLWLYSPMALPFVKAIKPALLVYDVMDELAAFRGAPIELQELDHRLLQQADVVFTGGVSLYRARQSYARNLHLFPSGVDSEHFATAVQYGVAEESSRWNRPADLAGIEGPILGYFGVIDERMDLPLLAQLAEVGQQPGSEWNVVLIGPIVKIEPSTLPQAPNLHYLGMKDYQDLPFYLRHFDVALVPFAINAATRYLSPTKTLEYLAAHKPVVTTPIYDIIKLYGSYVRIGHTPEAFVMEVIAALSENSTSRVQRQYAEQQLLARYHWDHIAREMHTIIQALLHQSSPRTMASSAFRPMAAPLRSAEGPLLRS